MNFCASHNPTMTTIRAAARHQRELTYYSADIQRIDNEIDALRERRRKLVKLVKRGAPHAAR